MSSHLRIHRPRTPFTVAPRLLIGALVLALSALTPLPASAFGSYRSRVPNGFTLGCLTCHNNSSGGRGCTGATGSPTNPYGSCLNIFGRDFAIGGGRWTAALASSDSDGDGWTNGQELGDPFAVWSAGSAAPSSPGGITSPGISSTEPTDFNLCDTPSFEDCVYPSPGGTCTSSTSDGRGLYMCGCASGYTGDGVTGGTGCRSSDPCASPMACGRHLNPANRCVASGDGFRCDCTAGFMRSGSGDSTTCVDINECSDASRCGRDLSASNTCTNSVGGYRCGCSSGFMLSGSGLSATCVDINECSASPCGPGMCRNTNGSYVCACPSGYRAPASGGTCADVDECADGTATCNMFSMCVNTAGTYRCDCATGFSHATPGDATSACVSTCGDGLVAADEACDDGNMSDGDGCSASCTVESGWACRHDGDGPSVCAMTCGNGMVDAGEECDDGDMNSDSTPNACRTNCQRAYCGDSVVDDGERCDPGGGAATAMTPGACTTACDSEDPDAGPMTPDAGSGMPDAMPPTLDSSMPGLDAGAPMIIMEDGCGCHIPGRSHRDLHPGWLLLGALLLRRRKRAFTTPE